MCRDTALRKRAAKVGIQFDGGFAGVDCRAGGEAMVGNGRAVSAAVEGVRCEGVALLPSVPRVIGVGWSWPIQQASLACQRECQDPGQQRESEDIFPSEHAAFFTAVVRLKLSMHGLTCHCCVEHRPSIQGPKIKDSRLVRGSVVEKPMINLSQETEALAQRIAFAKHVAVDDAVRTALEDTARAEGIALEARRPRDLSPEAVAARIARFDAIARQIALAPISDPRPVSEIVDDLNAL